MDNVFRMRSGKDSQEIVANSETEFILENYLGFAKVKDQKTYQYTVKHPRWKIYKVKNYSLKVDFGAIYGDNFKFLNKLEPHSVLLVEGSEVAIENKKIIKP